MNGSADVAASCCKSIWRVRQVLARLRDNTAHLFLDLAMYRPSETLVVDWDGKHSNISLSIKRLLFSGDLFFTFITFVSLQALDCQQEIRVSSVISLTWKQATLYPGKF